MPEVTLGDPGKVVVSLAQGPAAVTAQLTNTTEGSRPVNLDWGTPGFVTEYWNLPAKLVAASCTDCDPKKTYLRSQVLIGPFLGMAHADGIPVLAGDESTMLDAMINGAGYWTPTVFNSRTDGQFPESARAELEQLLGQPPNYVERDFSHQWLEDGVTGEVNCLADPVTDSVPVKALFDGSTGQLLSRSAAKATGIACT